MRKNLKRNCEFLFASNKKNIVTHEKIMFTKFKNKNKLTRFLKKKLARLQQKINEKNDSKNKNEYYLKNDFIDDENEFDVMLIFKKKTNIDYKFRECENKRNKS